MLVINSLHDNYSNITESLELYHKATDTILCDISSPKEGLVIFIDEDDTIEIIANYKIGRRIATRKNSIKFINKIDLANKITKIELINGLTKFKSRIEDIYLLTTISLLTPALGENIRKYIFDKNDNLNEHFKVNNYYKEISFSNYPEAKNEFDAISLPLKIIDIKDISFVNRTVTDNSSILDNIYSNNLIEDQMITHDYSVFMSKSIWDNNSFIGKEFYNHEKGESVSVFYANRTKWEKVIGVDLILYNSQYKAYLFIQYKRMIEENDTFVYRMDKQLDEEISRMTDLRLTAIQNLQTRLNSDPFYLKFCPSKQERIITSDIRLIKGIILPLGTLEYLRGIKQLVGKNGGELLSYENVKQYMDNSLLISLYKNGWIGSSEIDNKTVEDYIEQKLSNSHSIVLAKT